MNGAKVLMISGSLESVLSIISITSNIGILVVFSSSSKRISIVYWPAWKPKSTGLKENISRLSKYGSVKVLPSGFVTTQEYVDSTFS